MKYNYMLLYIILHLYCCFLSFHCIQYFLLLIYINHCFFYTFAPTYYNKHVRLITNKRQNEFCITDFE